MAFPTSKRPPGRLRTQLPTPYYEGYLEKKSPFEKVYRRLWTCLCGDVLFFYNNTKDSNYVEKLELSGFVSLRDDSSRDRNLGAARLALQMKDGNYQITAPSLEARELWKGFIYSVVELSVPRNLNLLPGQFYMLREVVEKEKKIRQAPPFQEESASNLYLPLIGEMPACYQKVTRMEAELLLEKHPDCGNLLLRPGRDGSSLAITTCQDLNGSKFCHYRVAHDPDRGYVINLEQPIYFTKLQDMIDYLQHKTSGTLQPFFYQEPYEDIIQFVQSDDENGEKSLKCAASSPGRKASPLPPTPEQPPSPEPWLESDSNVYLNSHEGEEKPNLPASPPMPPIKPVRKSLLPYLRVLPTTVTDGENEIPNPNRPPPLPPKPKADKGTLKVPLMPPGSGFQVCTTKTLDRKRLSLALPASGDAFPLGLTEELKERFKRQTNLD